MKKIVIYCVSFCFANANACTTIIVGKIASIDGSVIIARNVDSLTNKPVHYIKHSKLPNGYVYHSMENDFSYKIPKGADGYSGIPDLNTKDQAYEEAGFNDSGIAMSATETILSNAKTLALDPYNKKSGIKEDSVTSVILPQIKSARAGVLLLGQIIEKYGAGEGFGIAFADKNEAWYLENAGGHSWVAVRIPDDKYFVSANQSRIGKVNLKDSKNVLASQNLIAKSRSNNYHLDFFSNFAANSEDDITYNYYRVSSLQKMFTPSFANNDFESGDFPMFLKPDHLLNIYDVESGLKSYYKNSKNDPYTNKNPKSTYRPIAVFRTQESHILQLRDNLPPAIANIEYLALGMTALSIYVPFYQGANIPHEYQIGIGNADDASAFWRFRKLQTLVMQDFPKYAPIVEDAYAKLSMDISLQQKIFEKSYLVEYKKNPTKAQKLLDTFNSKIVAEVFNETDNLTNIILTQMATNTNQKYLFYGN